MKTKFKSCAAAAVSAVIAFCSMSSFLTSGAEADSSNEQLKVTLSYNTSEEGVSIAEDSESLESVELDVGETINIPVASLELDGFYFSGWTYDDVHLYESGDAFKMPETDITLQPVWIDLSDENLYELSYSAIVDGEEQVGIDLKPWKYQKGQAVVVSIRSFMRDGYTQIGWTDGTNIFKGDTKIIMPGHDLRLEPNWLKYYKCFYKAGDVDRVNGSTLYVFDRYEGNPFDLPDPTRFSRTGFKITGWTCDYDDQSYRPGANYIMPASDVTFTAIWTPITYTVLLKSNNGKNENIKIQGETDSAIVLPECTSTKEGYTFGGWKYNNDIYQPGDEFIVPGALPGLGISLSAVWNEATEPEEEAYDSIYLASARQKCAAGEISEDELREIADFIMNVSASKT